MDKYKPELINGKPVILLNGNMIEKGFISYSDAEKRANNLNSKFKVASSYKTR
ncbi:hypothetical protein ACNARU_16585 [Proteus sp. WDL240414]|uniref:hypothetical protein n=1 Tax=Proteus TaxID=583 RepID=UPI0013623905|nr:hypothetical protein [Proteus columbae]